MKSLAALVVLGLLLALSTAGQGTEAALSGSVNDPGGAAVAGATVVATNVATGVVSSTQTNDAGLFLFPALPPGIYSVSCEHSGFQKFVYDKVELQIGARVSLGMQLKLGSTSESVEVQGLVDSDVGYQNSSVGNVVSGRKVLELPLVGRNVYDLISTQAGVSGTNNQNFSGARASGLHVTMDGINIQDNYLSALSFTGIASTINVDRIGEFRIVTSPADAELGRGSGQIQLISRSGGNQFHGSVFEELRNTVATANTWFNNQQGNPRNFLNRNQYGGRLGGPIRRNRTFFHFYYEGQKQRAHDSVTSTVYTDTARQGVFRFFPGARNGNALSAAPTVDLNGNPLQPAAATGTLQSVSVFGRDPNRLVPDPSGNIGRTLGVYPSPNNFRVGDGLNTAGYTWIRNVSTDFEVWDMRIDHNFNQNHRLSFTFRQQHYDATNVSGVQPIPGVPPGVSPEDSKVATVSLTSTLRSNLINEFRAGVNRPRQIIVAPFSADPSYIGKSASGHPYLIGFTLINSPFEVANFGSENQGRISPVYQFGDTMTWVKGKHAFRGGAEVSFVSFSGYDAYAVMPRALLGAGNPGVANISTIAGIGTNLAVAQQMLNELSGTLAASYQTLNSAGGSNPQYVDGQTRYRTWRTPEVNWFFKDDWKITPRLTVNLGIRYELYLAPEETNGLGLGLVGGGTSVFGISGKGYADIFQPGHLAGSLMNFLPIGPHTQNPDAQLYPTDKNNFAPAIGVSWAPKILGEGKTIFRAGYGMGYEHVASFIVNQIIFGPGYQSTPVYSQSTLYNLSNLKLPLNATSAPLATVPLTDRSQPGYGVDPHLRTPYYQNFNVSVTRVLPRDLVFELRYVGNKGSKLIRTPNINEGNVFENGLLNAFQVTQTGGNAPLFDQIFKGIPAVGALSGSDFLRAFSTTQAFLANNNVGGLANYLNTATLAGQPGDLLRRAGLPENFIVANPQVASAFFISNASSSTYHSMQAELRKRFSKGWTFQGNYTFSKALGDDDGDEVGVRGYFRTLRNRSLDHRILSFSRTHAVRMNGIYELPFGPGRRYLRTSRGVIGQVAGGWQVGGLATLLSGQPISLTAVNAFNYLQAQGAGGAFSATATPVATTAIDKGLGELVKNGSGVVYFTGLHQVTDPSVANISSAAIRAQSTLLAIMDASGNIILTNPKPGQFGSLVPNFLRGPSLLRLDLNLIKNIRVRERTDFQLRADALNATNTPAFGNPVTDINSPQFGRIATLAGSARIISFSARLSF